MSSDFETKQKSDPKFDTLEMKTLEDSHMSYIRSRVEPEEIYIETTKAISPNRVALSLSDVQRILDAADLDDLPEIELLEEDVDHDCDLCGRDDENVKRYVSTTASFGISFHDDCLIELAQRADKFINEESDEIAAHTL